MIFKVLGSAGAEHPGYNLPAVLVDKKLLLDGGTICSSLHVDEQKQINNILLTHSHLDHMKGIPFFADNIVLKYKRHGVSVFGLRETLSTLRKNLLNNELWPDFTKISTSIEPVITFRNVISGRAIQVDGYTITAQRVNHTVPAVGYIVRDKTGKSLMYTGDTGPTDKIWKIQDTLNAIIVEVSFPSTMETLARKTGHLTPRLLMKELKKLRNFPDQVFIIHFKPQYFDRIKNELGRIRNRKIKLLKDGKTYTI